ncbi:uncharacterized protein LOC132382078 [Hypanus sabinus]|uniref:uncharacterized protein LOC132382078 n=1 Tax=Hypanus sabinus TaxID=79690 RepID=UPI0028C3B96F|nr:uncharacterized protein LOC132382078 [Hypanus sabinus]
MGGGGRLFEETMGEEVSSLVEQVNRQCVREERQVMEKGCAQPEDVGEKKEKDNKFECIVRDGKRGGDGENLKCIYFNARSIVRKVDELKAWIDTWNYDVVAISETWLQEGCDWQLNIPGFSCFRCDRVGGARGGGVALLVRENLMAVLWKDRLESSSREAIWMELKNGKGAVTLIGVYYRPPNGARELEEQMCKEIADICSKHKVVIVGDFNFPHVDWEAHSVKGLDGLEFVKCVQDSFLQQYIEVPTRDGAVLDLLLGNAIGQLTDVCVGEHFGSSDHNSISFNIIMEKDRTGPRVEIFDWRKANFEGMRRDLERVDWVKLFYGKDVIEKWRSFKGEIMRVQNLYVRVKGKVKGLRAPWFSRDIRNLVQKKRDVYNRYRQHGVKELLEDYKECKRNLKKEIRKAKRRYEVGLANKVKVNPKGFYSYIKSKRIVRDKIGPLENQGGQLCVEPKEMGAILNDFFSSVFTKEKDIELSKVWETSKEVMEPMTIKEVEVLALLRNLKVDKSPGPDRIFPRTLREVCVEIAGALTEIFNMSL